MATTLEPLANCEQTGWKAIGYRNHRGRRVADQLGVFASFMDADQAADEYHRSHRNTHHVSIEKHYEQKGEVK